MAVALPEYSDFSDEELSPVDIAFNSATNHVRKITSKLNTSQLLQLYGLYKQATEGNCNIGRPGWFNAQGRQKWDAWNALKDTAQDLAKEKYTELVQEFDSEWIEPINSKVKPGQDNVKPVPKETWVAVSSLRYSPEPELNANELSLIEAARENCSDRITLLLSSKPELKDEADEDGLTALHWAADRNALEALKAAIKGGCNVNSVDSSGQTPLHYASSCDNLDCVKILLEAGASPLVKDVDGSTPLDLASDSEVRKMLLDVTK